MPQPKINTKHRPLGQIAIEINEDWKNVWFGALPYLNAMRELDQVMDNYFKDPGHEIIRYFLANAQTWRGPKAREIKAELNKILKLYC